MLAISAGTGRRPTSSVRHSGKSGQIPSRPIPPPGTSARKAYEKTMREGTGLPQTFKDRLIGTYNYPAKPIFSKAVDTFLPHSDTSLPQTFKDRLTGIYNNPAKPIFSKLGDIFSPDSHTSGSGGFGASGGSGGSTPTSANEVFDYYEAPIAEKYGFSKTTAYQEALANTSYRREMEDMRKAGLNPSVIYGAHNYSGADSNIRPYEDYAVSSYGSSGGSGGSGGRSRGGNSGKYLFSGGAYYGIMFTVGAVTAMATHNVGAGMAAAGLTGTALKALNGFHKK